MTALTPSAIAAIVANAGANARTALAMMVGAYLESGADPAASGGGAYGVWQLQGDPSGADTAHAAAVMAPRYAKAAAQVPDALWTSDPARAAERAAFLAERPAADYYATQGAGRVAAAYTWAQGAAPTGPGFGPATGEAMAAGGADSGTIKVAGIDTGIPTVAGMQHYAILALAAVAGLVLIVIGAAKTVDAHPAAAAAGAVKAGAVDAAKVAAGA